MRYINLLTYLLTFSCSNSCCNGAILVCQLLMLQTERSEYWYWLKNTRKSIDIGTADIFLKVLLTTLLVNTLTFWQRASFIFTVLLLWYRQFGC